MYLNESDRREVLNVLLDKVNSAYKRWGDEREKDGWLSGVAETSQDYEGYSKDGAIIEAHKHNGPTRDLITATAEVDKQVSLLRRLLAAD